MRRGFTIVEVLVVAAVIATVAAILVPAFMSAASHAAAAGQGDSKAEPWSSWSLRTEKHDGHWWVRDAASGGHFVHHPDCPCRTRRAEAE